MIGILVATHGRLADELLNSAAMLVGQGEQMESVCVLPGQPPEEFLANAEQALERLDSGEGVVALVDIAGGTPNNTMFRLSKTHKLRIVTGVNLPMVMYSVLERYEGQTDDELVEALLQNGTSEINEFGKR